MKKAYKFRLYPNKQQEEKLFWTLNRCRELYNAALSERKDAYRAEKKLKKLQEALSRKKRGSQRRKKAVATIARTHRKVRNQRRDFAHKTARKLVNRYQNIVLEELQTKNLVRRPRPKQDEETGQYLPNGAAAKGGLNKSISDAGWSMFTEMLQVKAECAGRMVAFVDPKYTSQVCSRCGMVSPKRLAERWHSCGCGCELDRDTNAARNILKKHIGAGSVPQILPCGESVEALVFQARGTSLPD